MNPSLTFTAPPRLIWHGRQPFVVACLPPEYARELTALALQHEQRVTTLPVSRGWEQVAEANPTTARYSNYNAFLLDPRCLPLFLAVRSAYRILLQATGAPNPPRFIQSWYNVHRTGQHLHRHSHSAPYIAVFAACAEGSETSYGPFPVRTEHDRAFSHRDGQLIVTRGPNNYHEVSAWHREDTPRVTYACDILDAHEWSRDYVLLPFDGDGFPAAQAEA